MADPNSSKKLKQAQLPFAVKNNSNQNTGHWPKKNAGVKAKSKDASDVDKENILVESMKSPNTDHKDTKVKNDEILTIDLTDETSRESNRQELMVTDESPKPECSLAAGCSKMSEEMNRSIDEAIEQVVRRASSGFEKAEDNTLTPKATTSKKRHRSKSVSPIVSTAKRPVFSASDSTESVSDEMDVKTHHTASPKNIPVITITAPTPAEKAKSSTKKKSILAAYFESIGVIKSQHDGAKKEREGKESEEPSNANIEGSVKVGELAEHGSAKKRRRSGSPTVPVKVKLDTATQVHDQVASVTPSKKLKQENEETSVCDRKTAESVIDLDATSTPNKPPTVETAESVRPIPKYDIAVISSDEDEKDSDQQFQSPPPSSKPTGANLSDTPSPPVGPSITPKSLTKSGNRKPRQVNPEVLRRREEKEREKEEKRRQREEQRSAKEKEKMELKQKKDEEKAQKEEERRKKREEEELLKAEKLKKLEEKQREREQRELEKKIEKERKEEEKRKEKERREEEKRQKELEKQRLEEEKLHAVEEKRRKSEKRAENFKSFFKSPARSPSVKKTVEKIGFFPPFQLKANMSLAPARRGLLDSSKKMNLDEKLNCQDKYASYLKERAKSRGRSSSSSVPKFHGRLVSLSEDGLEVVEDGNSKPGAKMLRAKLLSFHANCRPPYYGTWRKTSKHISPRNPFKQDTELLDYDFDSDDEWEEPAEGEDIDNSDGEDEGEGNEEDEDDGFFVPHGYLSDDEGINGENEEDGEKPDHKLKQKQLEFEASFKRKLLALKPVVIGCVWKDSAESLSEAHRKILHEYKVEILADVPIEIFPSNNDNENRLGETPKAEGQKKSSIKAVPEEAMHDLIRLLHGNALSVARIVNEFREYWRIKQASNGAPLNCGPMSLEDLPADQGMEGVEDSDAATPSQPGIESPATGGSSPADSAQSSPASTLKSGNGEHTISKTQLLKRCKEIAAYCKKGNMNRLCWLVHDSILEKYGLARGKAPMPCRWNFVTEVPKIQVLVFPQTIAKLTPTAEGTKAQANATPSPNTGINIAKFVSKVSADDILQKSYLKHEQEKQVAPQAASSVPMPSIAKYTTDKVSPMDLIEKSAQKIAEDQATKAKRIEEQLAVEENSLIASASQSREGVYIIPTPAAIRTLFRIDGQAAQQTVGPLSNSRDVEMKDIEKEPESAGKTTEEKMSE